MVGKNYYRLTNDVILMLGETTTNINRLVLENGDDKQYVIPNRLNVIDFDDDDPTQIGKPVYANLIDDTTQEFGNTIKCRFLIRQNYKLPLVGFNLKLLRILNEDDIITKNCISLLFLSNEFTPSEVVYVDNNMFHSVVEIDLPSEFVSDTNSMFELDTEFMYDYGENIIITYQSINNTPIPDLFNMEFLLSNDSKIGNVENYINLMDNGFLEIGVKSLDDTKTLSGTIYDQLSINKNKPAITITHNIMHGLTNDPNATINDIFIIGDVDLANKNSLVPVVYKPFVESQYNPSSVFDILFIAVESSIVVGDTRFTRYNEAKFDYSNLFPVVNNVDVQQVEVINNYEQTQNIIVEKEVIKTVLVQQPVGFNLANDVNDYDIKQPMMGVSFNNQLTESSSVFMRLIFEDNRIDTLFPLISANRQMLMFDLSKSKYDLNAILDGKKTIKYIVVHDSDTFNSNVIVQAGNLIK